ncbi:MAG: ATP synthase F1 subunit delta [Phycisphaerae bacterium]|nr:ATP synthase F1 subunit delta [Phycisphaerae bacterium]
MAQSEQQLERAREFVHALLDLAEQANRVDEVQSDLDSLAELMSADAEFALFTDSPMIGAGTKFESLQRVLGGRIDDLTLKFLHVVAEHHALPLLRVLGEAFQTERDLRAKRVKVEATLARPMDEADRQQLVGRLAGMLKCPVKLEERVDPSLIGGVVIRIGDRLFDGSVRQRLEQLRRQVIARGNHEIQSRRDLIAD